MRTLAFGILLVLGLAACETATSTDEKRWSHLNNDVVYLAKGHEKIVHANPDCPKLAASKGDIIKCKVKHGRLMDESGIYMNGPEEQLPLCSSCVR
jgi:hypothetical protein